MSLLITFPNETIKTGSPFPQPQEIVIDYDPQRGFKSSGNYAGISQAQLLQLQQYVISQGIACRLRLFKDVGTLDFEDSTSEFTIDSWEVVGSDESQDGLSHPTMIALFSGDLIDNYAQLRQSLENNDKASTVYNQLISSGFDPDDATTVETFYSLQQRGSTNFRKSQYVLRHKTNVSNRWGANVSDVGIETIYTPAQLLTEVTDSGLWIFPLPPRLQYKIGAIPVEGPTENYLWGWLKSTSTESNVANNRVDIVTEYTLALWSVAPDGYYAAFDGDYSSIPYY